MKKFLPWIFSILIALFIALIIAKYESAVLSKIVVGEPFSLKRRWSDGFFVSGALFLSAGGLIAVGQNGGLDALRYALFRLAERIRHPRIEERDYEAYFDYAKKRAEKEKTSFAFLLVTGAIFLALSILLSFV